MAWTTISNALVAVGAKPFATTIQALRDNPIAIANGDSGAPKVKDAALDTGAATAAGTAWVGLRTAALSVGAVGSYAFLGQIVPSLSGAGTTNAGSNLEYTNAAGATPSGSPSGTWRLMGRTNAGAGAASTSLWLRIA